MAAAVSASADRHWSGFASAMVVLGVAWLFSLWKLRHCMGAPPHLMTIARSRFPSMSTKLLCGVRGAIAFYIFGISIPNLFHPDTPDGKEWWLFFYTAWNWMILGIYFALASVASFIWARIPEEAAWEKADGTVRLGVLTRSCSLLCSLNSANILMVDVAVWAVLYPTGDTKTQASYLSFDSLNRHAANFFLMLFELLVSDVPTCPRHVYAVIFFVATYGAFTIIRILSVSSTAPCITNKCTTSVNGYLAWPYFFLDTSTPLAGVWYLGLVGAETLFFFLTLFSRRAFQKCLNHRKESLMDIESRDPRIVAHNVDLSIALPHVSPAISQTTSSARSC